MLRARLALVLLLAASGLQAAGFQARARLSGPAPFVAAPALDAARLGELQSMLLVPAFAPGAVPAAARPGEYRIFQQDLFEALVVGVPERQAALRGAIAAGQIPLRSLKAAMYDSLFALYDHGGMLPPRREENAALLASRYAAFFDGLASDPRAKASLATRAEEAAAWVSDPRTMIWPLAETRQAFAHYRVAESRYLGLLPAPSGAPAQNAAGAGQLVPAWPRPAVRGKDERGHGADAPLPVQRLSMREAQETASSISFMLEKWATRLRLAQERGFSGRIVARVADELQTALIGAQAELLELQQAIRRHALFRVRGAFVELGERRRSVLHVPQHPGVRLVRVWGGYRIEASFKTDIDDDRTLALVKEAIEDYWNGRFSIDGKSYRLKSTVKIERLKPGEAFPDSHLRLVDGKDGFPMAGAWGIQLGRSPGYFYYGIAAHEFGHVVGLADEYWDDFDPETREGFAIERPASMMSASRGAILPRHMTLAVRLLRRKRYAGWSLL